MTIPEGWKLVPIKPTETMQDAFCNAMVDTDVGDGFDFECAYMHMVDAAPECPMEGQENG